MTKRWLIFLAFAAVASASAQSPSPALSPSPTATPLPRLPIWRCEIPGGVYEVAVRAIVSVSRHSYVVDGVARVSEVNLDTQGNMAARFYYLEPATPKSPLGLGQATADKMTDLAREAGERTGADELWKRVTKTFPGSTHAHTIEYRLASEAQLQALLRSAQEAFESGNGGSFSLPAQ